MNEEQLSESAIFHLRFDVREGVADPEAVKRVLRMFCRQVAKDDAVSRQTLEYLAEAFMSYLDSSKGIEAALGLKRKVGHPGGKERKNRRDTMMAHHFLRLRFEESKSYEDALTIVAKKHNVSEPSVRDAWSRHSADAFTMLRLAWIEDRREMTKDDLARFAKIFENMAWFVPLGTGNSPNFLD